MASWTIRTSTGKRELVRQYLRISDGHRRLSEPPSKAAIPARHGACGTVCCRYCSAGRPASPADFVSYAGTPKAYYWRITGPRDLRRSPFALGKVTSLALITTRGLAQILTGKPLIKRPKGLLSGLQMLIQKSGRHGEGARDCTSALQAPSKLPGSRPLISPCGPNLTGTTQTMVSNLLDPDMPLRLAEPTSSFQAAELS